MKTQPIKFNYRGFVIYANESQLPYSDYDYTVTIEGQTETVLTEIHAKHLIDLWYVDNTRENLFDEI